jgi:hypothetical protein
MTWTPEEQKEHRRIWVEALRSGRFVQTTGALKATASDAMCCLGVACEVSKLGHWSTTPFGVEPAYVTPVSTEKMKLPHDVQRWLGLADHWGGFVDHKSPTGVEELYQINDGGATFAEIADIIESEPEGLIAKVTSDVA